MQILWRLVLAHLLADFTFQTDYIAKWKRLNVYGGITHSLIFFVCGAALCSGSLGETWPFLGSSIQLNGWLALMLLSFFHFLEDEWRVWAIKRFNSADSFLFFVVDQVIHLLLIFIFFPPLAAAPREKIIFLAILFVMTTHFSSIFVYFAEKAVRGSAVLEPRERYYAMAERLAIGLALLLPGFWAASFVAAWLPRLLINKKEHPEFNVSFVNIAVSNLLAVLFGVIARVVYYG